MSHPIFFEIRFGNASAFKYGVPRAQSGHFNGISNVNL